MKPKGERTVKCVLTLWRKVEEPVQHESITAYMHFGMFQTPVQSPVECYMTRIHTLLCIFFPFWWIKYHVPTSSSRNCRHNMGKSASFWYLMHQLASYDGELRHYSRLRTAAGTVGIITLETDVNLLFLWMKKILFHWHRFGIISL